MTERMLFCRVAWMEHYRGNHRSDIPLRGGKFPDEHGFGFEMYNFLPDESGLLYGYMESRGDLQLWRIDASARLRLDRILVIWCANDAANNLRIVGWYGDATVFAIRQPCPPHLVRQRTLPDPTLLWVYHVRAPADKAVLLPARQRDFYIPRARLDGMGFGRHAVWYADEPEHQAYRRRVLNYVRQVQSRVDSSVHKRRHGGGYQPDTQRRQQVERAAVDHVTRCFVDLQWDVDDVSSDNLGWDLEARRLGQLLRIEVKGQSGGTIGTELTPSEYAAMKKYSPEGYCLCVVTDSLDENPTLHRFVYRGDEDEWEDEESTVRLRLKKRTSARIVEL